MSRFVFAVASVLFALCLCVPVLAQTPPVAQSGGPTDLTPDQQTRYQARLSHAREQYAAIQSSKTLSAAQKKARAVALAKQVDADTLSILTPTQRAFVLKNRATQAAFVKSHAAQIAAVRTLNIKINKSLSADQRGKLEAIVSDNNAQIKQIADDASLSAAQKQQQAAAIRAGADAKIKTVLTPAQTADQQKLQQMEKDLAAQARAAQGH